MIFQILVGQTMANYGNYPTINVNTPFNGYCKIKLIKLDYFFNTAGALLPRCVAINSRTFNTNSLLTPNAPLTVQVMPSMGRILFNNTENPYFGDNFEIEDIFINGVFDLTLSDETGATLPLPAVAGGYTNLLITLDIDYMKKYPANNILNV